jgi:hypothetical protein
LGEARSRPLNGPFLDLIAPIRPLQLCADGGYQLRFRSLEGTPNYGPRQVPSVGDKDYDEDEVAQIMHFNSQATTILLTSLSREEYNKVQGLKSAKEIWDVLKTTHEGDEVTKITKWETI